MGTAEDTGDNIVNSDNSDNSDNTANSDNSENTVNSDDTASSDNSENTVNSDDTFNSIYSDQRDNIEDSDEVLASAVGGEWQEVATREALPRKLRPFWAFQGSTALPAHSWEDIKGQNFLWFQGAQRQAQAVLSWILKLPGAGSQGRGKEESAESAEGAEGAEGSAGAEGVEGACAGEAWNSYFLMKKDGAGVGADMRKKSAGTAASIGTLPGAMVSQRSNNWGVYIEEVSN